MIIIDIILLILLFGFFIRGWQMGFIRMLAGLLGIIAGIAVAGHYYPVVADWLMQIEFLADRENIANFLSMIIIFLAVNGIIGVGAYLIDKVFHIFSFIPFLKTINRLAGSVLGILAGAFIFGFLILSLDKFPLTGFITNYLENSDIVPYLLYIAKLILPLWPEALKQIEGVLNK